MASVYILYSKSLDRYYVGSCLILEERMQEHLDKKYPDSFTAIVDDWELFLRIEDLAYDQARRIELHIKKMRTKKYIKNLSAYPELVQKIILRFQ